MKKIGFFLTLQVFFLTVLAQDVDYKKGMILVNDKDYARVEVTKQNFGLTKLFDVYSLAGEKIIIAVPATEFEQDKNDNTYLFYRFTFLTANQVGIFKVASLSQEKSFAKLIGNSSILVNDKVDESKVKQFIAAKGASPSIAVNYTLVARNKAWPITIQPDKNIEQNSKIIGNFKPTGTVNGADYYEFALPSGVVLAKVSFTGGNNAQNMELFTTKDNHKRTVPIPQQDKILAADVSIDKNFFTLRRIVKWLVDNQYL
jgi:hypothetical protein